MIIKRISRFNPCLLCLPCTLPWLATLATPVQSTVKQQLSAEEARVQAAELLRKAKLKREKEEAETARIREREVRRGIVRRPASGVGGRLSWWCKCRSTSNCCTAAAGLCAV